jgi:two-component system response regulator AtoC
VITRGEVVLDEAVIPFLKKETIQGEDSKQGALSLEEVEREHIFKILTQTNWHVTKSAQILGISRPTLRTKIREYKLMPNR